jgi:hypothetical protein
MYVYSQEKTDETTNSKYGEPEVQDDGGNQIGEIRH